MQLDLGPIASPSVWVDIVRTDTVAFHSATCGVAASQQSEDLSGVLIPIWPGQLVGLYHVGCDSARFFHVGTRSYCRRLMNVIARERTLTIRKRWPKRIAASE